MFQLSQHAEDINLSNGGAMNEGIVSTKLGIRGISNASEAIIVARDLLLLEKIKKGHYHVLHVSTSQAIDVIRVAKNKGLRVTAEAAPHHFILNDNAVMEFGSLAKMNPPLRAEKDRLAIIEGLKDGTIDCIATDHAPHDVECKNCPIEQASFGIVGLETMLPLSLELYHEYSFDLIDVLEKITYKAADVIHRNDLGRIRKNAVADLTIFALDEEWQLDISKLKSKSKNSPFDNYNLRGRVHRTVIAGSTVYKLVK